MAISDQEDSELGQIRKKLLVAQKKGSEKEEVWKLADMWMREFDQLDQFKNKICAEKFAVDIFRDHLGHELKAFFGALPLGHDGLGYPIIEGFVRALKSQPMIRACFHESLLEQNKDRRWARDEEEDEEDRADYEISQRRWTAFAVTLVKHHFSVILNLEYPWPTKQTALHLVATQGSPEVMEALLTRLMAVQGGKEMHDDVIQSRDEAERTALAISIDQLFSAEVKMLTKASKKLLEIPREGGRGTKSYPLHDLVISVVKSKLEKSDLMQSGTLGGAVSKNAHDILSILVEADPVTALTKACGDMSQHLLGAERVNEIPPYTLAVEAEKWLLTKSKEPVEAVKARMSILTSLRQKIRAAITRELHTAQDYERATVGDTSLQDKIAHLDLSDFDFLGPQAQVNDLGKCVENWEPRDKCLEFADMLSYVQLPDMSVGDPGRTHDAVKKLFDALQQRFKVTKIIKLVARDNLSRPMPDKDIARFVKQFDIEDLDWEKYNMDLDPFRQSTEHGSSSQLCKLRLYSTGHWGVIHHWTSLDEGIYTLKELMDVKIVVMTQDSQHTLLPEVETLKTRINKRLDLQKDELEAQKKRVPQVKVETGYPRTPRKLDNYTPVPVSDQFFVAFKAVQDMVVARDNKMNTATNQGTKVNDNRLTQEEIDELGLRTKVAIIDNGVDIGQPAISANIRRGRSFVNSYASSEWLLPWYTAAHAHGTYMASLVVKVDPCCDLYVYRINTLPVGRILSEHAARAIKIAAETDGVDIINLSWSFRRDPGGLQDAVKTAVDAKPKALIFCAKSDELYVSESVPADWDNTISVAAATSRGRIGTEGGKAPDLVIQGEDMPVWGPDYAVGQARDARESGSSVATALASGMASLILMLAKQDDELKHHWERLKGRDTMVELFRRLHQSDGEEDRPNTVPAKTIYVYPNMLFRLPKEELLRKIKKVVF